MDLDPDLDLNADLDLDLDDYLLHPQTPPCLRVIHAFMCTDRTIEHVREETVRIEDGVLRQEQLIWCIKQQQQQQKQQFGRGVGLMKHFKLRAMFLYNMDLAAEEVRDFLKMQSQSQSHESLSSRFLTPISAVEDVVIKPTIPMFARLNALHIMYQASDQQKHLEQQQHSQHNRSIKRIVIHKKKQKKRKHTRRT
jgi:uncharacterized protein (UPF0147 family)